MPVSRHVVSHVALVVAIGVACSAAATPPDGGKTASAWPRYHTILHGRAEGHARALRLHCGPARRHRADDGGDRQGAQGTADRPLRRRVDALPRAPGAAANKPQAELTADLVAKLLPELGLAASGLGRFDLGAGAAGVRFPRQAANVTAGAPVEAPKIVEIGGVKVGVFGVVDPVSWPAAVSGVTAGDATAAARSAISTLRGQGAQVVVALAQLARPAARKLAREAPGIDFLLVGQDAPDQPPPGAEAVGTTFLVTPANRGQVLARLDLHVDAAPGPLTDAIGPDRAAAEGKKLEERIAQLTKDLAGWEKDPSAEKAFVERNRADLETMKKDRQALAASPLRAPSAGSWFVLRQVAIKKGLACDPAVVARKQKLDEAVGAANRAAAKDEKPPAPAPGRPTYAGIDDCADCHKEAVAFWKKTPHAKAWKTLTAVGKQWNRDCIGCHLTGWAEPGGATLADNEKLREVQCEVCHGPGSLHVDAPKKEPLARAPAPEFCASRCHTKEHSDTFVLDAYLRDVTGPGHGAALRAKLGKGPTGHELRSAALAKAGQGIGAKCPR